MLVETPLAPYRASLNVATVSPAFSLFVSVGIKATGKAAFSDLPQKSDHALSTPYSTSQSGTWWPAGDLLCMCRCPVCVVPPACAVAGGRPGQAPVSDENC